MNDAFSNATPLTLSTDLRKHQVGIYIATNGNLTVKFHDGSLATFTAVTAGTFIPVRCKQVTAAPANTLVLYG